MGKNMLLHQIHETLKIARQSHNITRQFLVSINWQDTSARAEHKVNMANKATHCTPAKFP